VGRPGERAEEWDEFEWGCQRLVEERVTQNPEDSVAADRLVARRNWMDGYLKWGRDTLGYVTYLFRKP